MRLNTRHSKARGFSLVELICAMLVILILSLIITPRIMAFRHISAQARNGTNVRTFVAALQRAQIEGKVFTNSDSVESLVAQLVSWRLMYDSPSITSLQITMIDDGGILHFYPTYDP